MSWLATKYAWKCRHDDVKGSVRLVMLAIALRVRKNYISTVPTALSTFERLTFLSDDTVRRCLDVLERSGEVRRVRRGKRAVYAMVKMAGPLFVETPQDAVFFDHTETPQDAGISHRNLRGNSAVSAGGVLLSGGTSTNVPTTTAEHAAAEAFLDWFLTAYQRHRGVLYRVPNPAKAEEAARELLTGRSVDRLKAMALTMWADTADPWLNDALRPNDRGIFSLRHKATYLETIVARADSPTPTGYDATARCPHSPKCLSPWDCSAYNANAKEAHG